MVHIEHYLYDGASFQARMVLCYLQAHIHNILKNTWSYDEYKGKLFLNPYQYGREKGYVFSLRYNDHQSNYAVYEHCISDQICVVKSNAFTEHSDGWDGREWSKYDHDKNFGCDEATKCAKWLIDQMIMDIDEWQEEEKKKSGVSTEE